MAEIIELKERLSVRCAVCDSQRPVDGKILNCLHVACQQCLEETLASSGAWQCMICKTSTRPASGVKLVDVLVDSAKYLYPTKKGETEFDRTGSDGAVLCAVCDCPSPKVATHRCHDCQLVALCSEHASIHEVEHAIRESRDCEEMVATKAEASQAPPANVNGTSHTESESGSTCPVHQSRFLSHFCTECKRSVCERCVITGHKQHKTETLAEAGNKKRQQLSDLLHSSHKSGKKTFKTSLQDVGKLMSQVDAEIGQMKTEAANASEAVVQVFEEIEKFLAQEKSKALERVELVYRQQQSEWDDKRRQLERLEATCDTAVVLATCLEASESSDGDVISLADCITAQLEHFTDDVASHSQLPRRTQLCAVADGSADNAARCHIKHCIAVPAVDVDPSQSSIVAPCPVYPGRSVTILVDLFDADGRRLPPIPDEALPSASITDPASRQTSVALHAAQGPTAAHATCYLTHSFPTTGCYRVEVAFSPHAVLVADVKVDNGGFLDYDNHTSGIFVSQDGLQALNTRKAGIALDAHVVGVVGHRAGVHRWRFSVFGLRNNRSQCVAVGVTTLPLDVPAATAATGDAEAVARTGAELGWSGGTAYVWFSSAFSCGLAEQQTKGPAMMSRWRNNDTLDLTLDCDRKSLELHLERTGERKTIMSIDNKGKELYLYVFLSNAGNCIQFHV